MMQRFDGAILGSLLLSLIVCLGGCAAGPLRKPDPRDRFEPMNRSIYAFNDKIDKAVLRPVARAYRYSLPRPLRNRVSNMLSNLDYSRTIINDFLQGKADDGVNDVARLVVNTIIGVGGMFDPATRMGIEKHDLDFGQTLGHWGVPAGPYLVLPFLGPSDVRDTISLVPDAYSIPIAYYKNKHEFIGITYAYAIIWTVDKIDARSQLLDADKMLDSAYDPYALMRSAYLQRRDYLIHGNQSSGAPAMPDIPEDPEPDAAGASAAPVAPSPPAPAPPPAPATPAPAPGSPP